MRRVVVLAAVWAAGCGGAGTPAAKYFAGKPVDHWLAALKGNDPKGRKHAADVLGNVGPMDQAALPALTDALADKDAGVRGAAVLGLSKNGRAAADALPRLRALQAGDPNPTVRRYAQLAVEQITAGG